MDLISVQAFKLQSFRPSGLINPVIFFCSTSESLSEIGYFAFISLEKVHDCLAAVFPW
jgi:hypothetical protein